MLSEAQIEPLRHSQHHSKINMLTLAAPSTMITRLAASALALPTLSSLQHVLTAVAVVYAGFAAGVKLGLYPFEPMRQPGGVGWSAVYMLARAVLEESLFRGLLLPNLKVDGVMAPASFAKSAVVPLILFVLSHAWTTQRASGRVLTDTKFLGTVTLLGVACSWVWWMTGGQLWAVVLLHWLVTFPYMVLMGGHRKTHTPTMMKVERSGVRRDMAPAPVQESDLGKEK